MSCSLYAFQNVGSGTLRELSPYRFIAAATAAGVSPRVGSTYDSRALATGVATSRISPLSLSPASVSTYSNLCRWNTVHSMTRVPPGADGSAISSALMGTISALP